MNNYFLDQYIIFDVAISDKKEIVEIGAIKLNEKLELIDTFHSIEQFEINVPKFESWIINGTADYKFMYSWGRNQRDQLRDESVKKAYHSEILDLILYHSSLQHVFKNMKNNKLYTIKKAMSMLDIPYRERNSLMDDVENATDIFVAIYGKWIHPGVSVFPNPDEPQFTGEKYWLNK